ncbi:MAG: hypothetical protein RLN75_04665 [Longimicrobiales bacterium]
MRSVGVALFFVFVVWLQAGAVEGRLPARCDMSSFLARPEGFVAVLAKPTPDSILAELNSFDWYDWAGDSFTPKPAPSDRTWGQVFEAVDVLDPDSLGLVRPGEEFVAVPWVYDAACHPEPWDSSAVWVGAAEQVFYMRRTRRIRTLRGPVVDVLGWHSPYPRALFLKYETEEPRADWLPATTYFEFLRGFRPEDSPESRMEALESWRSRRPDELRFPVSELHLRFRRYFGRGGGQ